MRLPRRPTAGPAAHLYAIAEGKGKQTCAVFMGEEAPTASCSASSRSMDARSSASSQASAAAPSETTRVPSSFCSASHAAPTCDSGLRFRLKLQRSVIDERWAPARNRAGAPQSWSLSRSCCSLGQPAGLLKHQTTGCTSSKPYAEHALESLGLETPGARTLALQLRFTPRSDCMAPAPARTPSSALAAARMRADVVPDAPACSSVSAASGCSSGRGAPPPASPATRSSQAAATRTWRAGGAGGGGSASSASSCAFRFLGGP